MASELSRLIDDELEKFERRPSADRPTQKASFSIKDSAQQTSSKAYSWRQREWWTWRRIAYVTLMGMAFVGILVLLPRGSAAAKTALAGTNNAAISQSGEAVGAGFYNSKEAEASPSASPMPKHTQNSSSENEGAAPPNLSTAASNQTGPGKVNGNLTAMTPAAFATAPSPASQENAAAPSAFAGALIKSGQTSNRAPSHAPSAFLGTSMPAPSKAEALESKAPSSMLKFSLGRGRRLLDQQQ